MRLSVSDFKPITHEGGKVVSTAHPSPLHSQEIFLVLISVPLQLSFAGFQLIATKIDSYASIAPQVSTIPTLQNTPPPQATSRNSNINQNHK